MHKLFLYDIINDDNIYNDLFKFLKIIQKKYNFILYKLYI